MVSHELLTFYGQWLTLNGRPSLSRQLLVDNKFCNIGLSCNEGICKILLTPLTITFFPFWVVLCVSTYFRLKTIFKGNWVLKIPGHVRLHDSKQCIIKVVDYVQSSVLPQINSILHFVPLWLALPLILAERSRSFIMICLPLVMLTCEILMQE